MNSEAYSLIGYEERELDKGVIAGVFLSFGLIVAGMLLSGKIGNFFSPAGVLIVIGGTFSATLLHFSYKDLVCAFDLGRKILFQKDYDAIERINYLVNLSKRIRQGGELVMDHEASRQRDPFLKKALEITVDGQDPNVIKRILETEMRTSHHHSTRAVQLFQTMGTYAPALGLIGTLIGLIQMLGSLGDASSVGPAMAVALTGTFYGAVMANLLFLPIAGKIKTEEEEGLVIKAITVEAMMSIARKENPMMMEQRLESFLPMSPSEKV